MSTEPKRPPDLADLPLPLAPGEEDWPGWSRISRRDALRMRALSRTPPEIDAGIAEGW